MGDDRFDDPGSGQHCQTEQDMIKTTDCYRAGMMEEDEVGQEEA